MRCSFSFLAILAGLVAAGPALAGAPDVAGSAYRMAFDDVAPGALPAGWTVDATHAGKTLARWKVAADPKAPSAPNVLRVFPPSGNPGGTFNMCWTRAVRFDDGEIEVRLRADAGSEDQGGGPAWRIADRNNYYVARYNPLEHNFRLYRVRDGHRRMIATSEKIPIGAGTWFTIRIVHRGDHIQCFLDGEKRIDVHDTTFTGAGGVGLWTKADAATSFDDFAVRPEENGR